MIVALFTLCLSLYLVCIHATHRKLRSPVCLHERQSPVSQRGTEAKQHRQRIAELERAVDIAEAEAAAAKGRAGALQAELEAERGGDTSPSGSAKTARYGSPERRGKGQIEAIRLRAELSERGREIRLLKEQLSALQAQAVSTGHWRAHGAASVVPVSMLGANRGMSGAPRQDHADAVSLEGGMGGKRDVGGETDGGTAAGREGGFSASDVSPWDAEGDGEGEGEGRSAVFPRREGGETGWEGRGAASRGPSMRSMRSFRGVGRRDAAAQGRGGDGGAEAYASLWGTGPRESGDGGKAAEKLRTRSIVLLKHHLQKEEREKAMDRLRKSARAAVLQRGKGERLPLGSKTVEKAAHSLMKRSVWGRPHQNGPSFPRCQRDPHKTFPFLAEVAGEAGPSGVADTGAQIASETAGHGGAEGQVAASALGKKGMIRAPRGRQARSAGALAKKKRAASKSAKEKEDDEVLGADESVQRAKDALWFGEVTNACGSPNHSLLPPSPSFPSPHLIPIASTTILLPPDPRAPTQPPLSSRRSPSTPRRTSLRPSERRSSFWRRRGQPSCPCGPTPGAPSASST